MDRNLVVGLLRTFASVALRKESVDRNVIGDVMGKALAVALRKESVDRNRSTHKTSWQTCGRSPQGERG